MGCSFETANRQRNQCSISNSNSSNRNNNNNDNNNQEQHKEQIVRIQRQNVETNITKELTTSTTLTSPTTIAKAPEHATNNLEQNEECEFQFLLAIPLEENTQTLTTTKSIEKESSHFGNKKLIDGRNNSNCNRIELQEFFGTHQQQKNRNCHCKQLTEQATSFKSSIHKSNSNDSCPKNTNNTNQKSEKQKTTIDNTTITTTPTTNTKYDKCENVEKSQIAINQQFQHHHNYQSVMQQQQQQQQHPQQKPAQVANNGNLHSYRNATLVTRNLAATMAAACASSSCTVHELFNHARNVLTTRLTHVSGKLIDNFSYNAEAAAVATTGRNAKLAHKRHLKQNKTKKKNKQQRQQQQQQTSPKFHYCTRHCSQRDTSQISLISATSNSMSTSSITSACSSASLSSSSSSSSPSPLSSSIKCSNCKICTSASISVSTSFSVIPATTVSASATVTTPSTVTSSSLAATTAAMAHASSTAAAAYNYIGHNYYHLLRNTISFYAASSVILVLCYLTTVTSAAATNSEAAPLETHPIGNFDWSKFDESSSDKEILDMLLEKKRYDKRLLPPVNDEDFCCGLSSPDMAINQNTRRPHNRGTLTVNVNVLLLSLASPDESSLKYEVEFLLNQQWNDPRLQYGNKSHYDFLNALHHHDGIWTPDTYFIMHGDFKDPIIPMHFALRIYRNGTITYAMRRHLILSCQGSLHIFPFDDPKCSFSMESISYEVAQIKYVWKNDEDTLRKSPSLTTLNAYLIKNQTTACEQTSWRGNYSCLRVDLIFTRDRAFYFTTVFIPGIILVTSSFITFWLEWNAVPARSMIGNYSCLLVALTFTRDRAYYFTTVFIPGIILVTSSFITFWLEWNAVPARVMIGVTTMLNFFTTSNGFRSTLPVVSNLTAMNVWDGVCMCFIYASLLEFVCVNYVGRKRPLHNVVYRPGENPVTQRLPAVLSRIGVILASPLEIIEREFQTALSSEKAAAGLSSGSATMPHTPTSTTSHNIHWERHYGGGMIGTAVKNLRARSMRRRCERQHHHDHIHHSHGRSPSRASSEHICAETVISVAASPHQQQRPSPPASVTTAPTITTTVTVENDLTHDMETFSTTSNAAHPDDVQLHLYSDADVPHESILARRKRSHSIATNTTPLILPGSEKTHFDIHVESVASAQGASKIRPNSLDIESAGYPVKPPRKKTSRSTSPAGVIYETIADTEASGAVGFNKALPGHDHVRFATSSEHGEKRRDAGAPNEIVACTTCGGSSSPCTHSANNGCATETCFVQVRKKEPPHPIRVAKTIDVIARITFPTAYAIFLIFFFVHYKGFS